MDLTEFNEIRPVRRNLISRKHFVMVFCGR